MHTKTGGWLWVAATATLGAGCLADEGVPGDHGDPGAGAAGFGGAAGGTGVGGFGQGGGGGSGPEINQGFIGGPCASDDDCAYEGGYCLTEDEGFPGGMCSADCVDLCPDEPGAVWTFCVNPAALGTVAADGLCTIRCDYGQSPTGCRAGYQCQPFERHEEPEKVMYVCVPGDDDPFQLSACHEQMLAKGIGFCPAVNPLDSPDGHPELVCDIEDPVYLDPILHDVAYRPGSADEDAVPIFTACPHALAMAGAAQVAAAAGVEDIIHWGVYNCRVIAGTSTISQHGMANAIDFAGFHMAAGPTYTVLADWEQYQPNPTTNGGLFLYDFAHALYDQAIYNIILTPDYNEAHEDHFHCDLTPDAHFLE